MQTTLKIGGMTCQNCVAHVEKSLEAVPGVQSVMVDLGRGEAKIEHEGADVQKMIAAVEEEGYEAQTS